MYDSMGMYGPASAPRVKFQTPPSTTAYYSSSPSSQVSVGCLSQTFVMVIKITFSHFVSFCCRLWHAMVTICTHAILTGSGLQVRWQPNYNKSNVLLLICQVYLRTWGHRVYCLSHHVSLRAKKVFIPMFLFCIKFLYVILTGFCITYIFIFIYLFI